MAVSTVLFLFAAAASGRASPLPVHQPTKAVVAARATVRILPGVKVSLSQQAETQGYRLNSATITAEDGRRLSAKLVEFQ